MALLKELEKWELENRLLIEEIRDYKGNEYKKGFADGMETALDSLKSYLQNNGSD